MTVDRYIAVRYPLQAASYCSARRSRRILLVLLTGCAIYNIPYIYTTGVVNHTTCVATMTRTTFTLSFSLIRFLLNAALPFTFLLALNVRIITIIRNRQQLQLETRSSTNEHVTPTVGREPKPASHRRGGETQLTLMLLLVVLTLVTLTTPHYIYLIIYSIRSKGSTAQQYAQFVLIFHITNKMYNCSFAVNFFLYCISGTKFRNDLALVINNIKRLKF